MKIIKITKQLRNMAYIKNIIKIEMTEAENLKSVVFPMDQRCIVPSAANFRSIQCKVPSSCEISDKVESKVRIFTSKLTFKSCEQIDPNYRPLAFRITTADGIRYLMGCDRRPYSVLTRTENLPSSHTESSLITYTATWTDVIRPLQIIE